MSRGLKFTFILCLVVLVFLAIFYALLPWLISPADLEQKITEQIEQRVEGVFGYERTEVSYFPFLKISFHGARLKTGDGHVAVETEKMMLTLRVLSALFGEAEWGRFEADHADIRLTSNVTGIFLRDVHLTDAHVVLKAARRNQTYEASLESGLEGASKALKAKLQFKGGMTPSFNLEKMSIQGDIAAENLNADILTQIAVLPENFEMNQGKVGVQMTVDKNGDSDLISLSGKAGLHGFSYSYLEGETALSSPKIDMNAEFEAGWNLMTEELAIRRSSVQLPEGQFEVAGSLYLSTGEIQELRFSGIDLLLERIPQYLVMIKDKIPYNIGFSGASSWDLTLSGTWDHLSLDANIDLSQSVLTYSRFFSKSKDVLMSVQLDVLIKRKRSVQGDFAVRFPETTFKGNIADLDLVTGVAQISMMSNKFKIDPWVKMLLPLQRYELQGLLKILASFEGGFWDWEEAKKIVNVTLEHAYMRNPEGAEIKNGELIFDLGQMGLDVKRASFQLGESRLDLSGTIYHLFENPLLEADIRAEYMEPLEFLEALRQFESLSFFFDPALDPDWSSLRTGLARIFPPGSHVRNLETKLRYKEAVWKIENLRLNAYGGAGKLDATWDLRGPFPLSHFHVQIDGWQVRPFAYDRNSNELLLEGNLFLNMGAGMVMKEKKSSPEFEGEGTLLITEGTFHPVDLTGAVARISEFSPLQWQETGETSFDDLRLQFTLDKDKMVTEDLILTSNRFLAEASGEIFFSGIVNFRLGIYLTPEDTVDLLTSFGYEKGYQGRFGPIPFVLTGPLTGPEILPAPDLLPELISDLNAGKAHKVLRNFLPEETLFRERTRAA